MKLITLREMCALVGVSRRVIQCYEKVGLMKSTEKNKYGYLLYDEETLARAKRIRFWQKLGFRLNDIKKIIDAPRDVMKEALEKRVKELEEEAVRLDQIIKVATEYMESLG